MGGVDDGVVLVRVGVGLEGPVVECLAESELVGLRDARGAAGGTVLSRTVTWP